MKEIPLIAFSAYSGAGKTTLIEKLIVELKAQGLRLAVVKHDGHDFEIDHEGKDSWRFAQAGADMTVICSDERTAVIEQRGSDLQRSLGLIHDVDLVLVEGFKYAPIPRVGICRKASGKGLPAPAEEYLALVTDDEDLWKRMPGRCFGLEDVYGLAAWIRREFQI